MDGRRLELHVLRSGDHGVCMAVRDASSDDVVCVDCGISGQVFAEACSHVGINPFKVRAFLITHGHGNQVKGVKSTLTWLAKRGVLPAVYVEPGVLAATAALQDLGEAADVRPFATQAPFCVGSLVVRPFRTFHNNEDKGGCYNFRIEAGGEGHGDAVVLLSDAGVLSREAQAALPGARVLGVEANYDPSLFDEAARGNRALAFAVDVRGNFSNAQAATVVRTFAWPGLEDVVALYPSRQFNAPDLARAALREALDQVGCRARVSVASADEPLSVVGGPLPAEPPAPARFEEVLTCEQAAAASMIGARELAGMVAGGAMGAGEFEDMLREQGFLDPSDGFPTEKALALGAWVAARRSDEDPGKVEAFAVFPEGSAQELARALREGRG